jgi:integrase
VSRLEKGRRKSPRALTADEAAAFLSRLKESELARRHDLHDLMLFLLATGVRIGEALALRWCDVDLDAAVVDINGTITRIRGKGLVRSDVKTETSERMLRLPAWCVDALRTRYKAQAVDAPVFPDTKGGYRDPSNTGKVFRKVRGDDFAWVKSHTARRTLATLLDGAGLSARDIADQLGHARPSMTQDVYMGRRIVGQVTTPLDGLFIAKVQGPMEAETEAEAS